MLQPWRFVRTQPWRKLGLPLASVIVRRLLRWLGVAKRHHRLHPLTHPEALLSFFLHLLTPSLRHLYALEWFFREIVTSHSNSCDQKQKCVRSGVEQFFQGISVY
jgi:hypothetical protein